LLQLLQPIWLIAMAGVAFPVLLHLWNNKQGKVLPIGSIVFLEKGERRQAPSRRLSERWLLLLRCLLLLLLGLLLSGPFWRLSPAGNAKKGWILVEKAGGPVQEYKSMIDSLLKAGYEWHEWGKGEAMGAGHERLSYWDLFRMADRDAPAGIPFYVFTSGRRPGYMGRRPATGRMVYWYTYNPFGDSVRYYVAQAWLASPDSIGVLMGSSRSTGGSYSYQVLPARAGAVGQGTCRIGLTNGDLSVALDSQPPVRVDTTVLRIQICADKKHDNDSRYLEAAIHALQQFTRRNIQMSVTGTIPDPALHAGQIRHLSDGAIRSDWVFWLSSQPVPAGLASDNVVCYEPGREIPVDTWIQGIPGIAVEKLAGTAPSGSPVIWKDGFGRPILVLETISGRRIFHFFSHFDPAWNGLVWSPRFPVLLQDLLFRNDDVDFISKDRDYRMLDPAQILPQKISAEEGNAPMAGQPGWPADRRPSDAIDLAPACWVLIFLLFLAERMLSFRSPKLNSYG